MRIAVLSDTHDRLPERLLTKIESASVDEIWHLGDVCEEHVLIEIQALGKPLYVVRGNCDDNFNWPLTRDLEREGLRFHLVHIPRRTAPEGCDVLLHGHTHVPRDEMVEGVRFLNPGCITRPNRGAPPSYAILEINEGELTWKLKPVPL